MCKPWLELTAEPTSEDDPDLAKGAIMTSIEHVALEVPDPDRDGLAWEPEVAEAVPRGCEVEERIAALVRQAARVT